MTPPEPRGLYDCAQEDQRAQGVQRAVAAVHRGDLVVLPTDTTYGLGCDAFRPEAVRRLRRARGGSSSVPLPVLVGSAHTLEGLVTSVPADARRLVAEFWPGPLTVIVTHAPSLAWDLGDSQGTVAVRMPRHPVALEVLTATGPMAMTGAHRPGWPVPQSAAEAWDQLGDSVSVYLESSTEAPHAGVSTVVDLTGPVPRLARPGLLTLEQVRSVVPHLT